MNGMFYRSYFYVNLVSALAISITMLIKGSIIPGATVAALTLSSLVGTLVNVLITPSDTEKRIKKKNPRKGHERIH